MSPTERNCAFCNDVFEVFHFRSYGRKYCDKTCAMRAATLKRGGRPGAGRGTRRNPSAKIEMQCAHCSISFLNDKYHPHRRYCSRACWHDAVYGSKVAATCKHCSVGFMVYPRPVDGKATHGAFCSRRCMGLHNSKKVAWNCTGCGKEVMLRPALALRRKYCSRECSGAHHRGPNFRGEKPPEKRYVSRQVKGRRTQEHREVMERMIGRSLLPGENVHHLNGVRNDNRPENLELWSRSQPSGQRVADKVAWAVDFLRSYPEVLADLHGLELRVKLRVVRAG